MDLHRFFFGYRHYRPARLETPTYTGGVSNAYRDQKHRREKERHKDGIYSSSKQGWMIFVCRFKTFSDIQFKFFVLTLISYLIIGNPGK